MTSMHQDVHKRQSQGTSSFSLGAKISEQLSGTSVLSFSSARALVWDGSLLELPARQELYSHAAALASCQPACGLRRRCQALNISHRERRTCHHNALAAAQFTSTSSLLERSASRARTAKDLEQQGTNATSCGGCVQEGSQMNARHANEERSKVFEKVVSYKNKSFLSLRKIGTVKPTGHMWHIICPINNDRIELQYISYNS